MKPLRLTPQAEARLTDIAHWTVNQFRADQARRYEREVIDCLKALASGNPPHGRPCSLLVPAKDFDDALCHHRQGQHHIIYQDTPVLLIVVDFVHGSRDLPGILADLARR